MPSNNIDANITYKSNTISASTFPLQSFLVQNTTSERLYNEKSR